MKTSKEKRYDLETTLFVSDLDGTLLGSNGKLHPDTVRAVNSLVKCGVKFTFATARSYTSAMWVAGELELEVPMILHNGVFIRDKNKGVIRSHLLESPERIRDLFREYNLSPFVYSVNGDEEKYRYIPESLTREAAKYQATRINDPRDTPVKREEELWQGDIYHVLSIDNCKETAEVFNILKDDYTCFRERDYYSKDTWLEVFPREAGKASAVLELRELMGCERVVVFGDGANDISMFTVSDEAYAVSGGVDALKKIATSVIGSCDDGAVVKWISENIKL